ncbi:MAG: tRNA pseudouridine synthase A [Bacteroidota bacterium]|nr:tRNA pseudouridine synthase A [Bacteroidota bacterium]
MTVHDSVYDKLLWLLSKFNKEEVEIVSDDSGFIATQKYLQKEIEEIKSGEAVFYSQEELDKRLDKEI